MIEDLECVRCHTVNEFNVGDYDAHYNDDCYHGDCYSDADFDAEIERVKRDTQRRYDRYVQEVHQTLHVGQEKVSSLFADNCLQNPCMTLFQDLAAL